MTVQTTKNIWIAPTLKALSVEKTLSSEVSGCIEDGFQTYGAGWTATGGGAGTPVCS